MVDMSESGSLSVDDVSQAISKLSSPDLIRLKKIASRRARGISGLDPDDLVQEAIIRVMDGRRLCPRNLELIRFLCGVMKSIASEVKRQQQRFLSPSSAGSEDSESDFDYIETIPSEQSSPEEMLIIQEELSKFYNLFSDDEKAFFILMGKLEGQSAEEIRQNEGIDHTTYATTLRRIRRKIEWSQTGKSHEQTV